MYFFLLIVTCNFQAELPTIARLRDAAEHQGPNEGKNAAAKRHKLRKQAAKDGVPKDTQV